ncbi:nucleotidyltransferase domain-containing protein [Kribbella sp. NPDC051586]|uniref:nucleotidyltransferase domain-containing protein n=1 Tax=Kribbella sp. NPDC051586 TaxID=3364118 RepID=UPI0037B133D4
MTEMTAERVLELLDALAGLEVWVDGGWGVDALVGRQTRPHGDLDLGVARPELDRVVERLGDLGYDVTDARYVEVTVQLTHAVEGHRVDLHPSTPLAGGGTEQLDFDGHTHFIPPPTSGRIDGRLVRCMPASAQRQSHQGYEFRPQDLHDMDLLDGLD